MGGEAGDVEVEGVFNEVGDADEVKVAFVGGGVLAVPLAATDASASMVELAAMI